mmetsp:Transcript_49235/g.72220  ORF Transcript_49235/g.72220 Transcript_49235/m.72220 type:complete len:86 (+) Transcript_49235:509-766(+)
MTHFQKGALFQTFATSKSADFQVHLRVFFSLLALAPSLVVTVVKFKKTAPSLGALLKTLFSIRVVPPENLFLKKVSQKANFTQHT